MARLQRCTKEHHKPSGPSAAMHKLPRSRQIVGERGVKPTSSVAGWRLPAGHEIQERRAKIGQPLLADPLAAEQGGG